jgi:ribonucleoside-diphosphate reductase beta chain
LLPALGIIDDTFSLYDPIPFDVTPDEFSGYAAAQFSKRLERVRKARGMNMYELDAVTHAIIEDDDA